MVDAVYSVSSFPDPEGLGEVILFGVGHGFRVIDLLAFVALGMAGRGLEGVVDRFVTNLEEERFSFFGGRSDFLEPTDGLVGQQVGVVSLEVFSFAVDIEGRIEIGSLSGETDPVVEALAGSVVFMAHVPLPDVTGAVARFPEVFGKEAGAGRYGSLVVHHPVVAHVLPGQDGSPAGGTKRSADEGVGQMGSLFGKPVEVRGLEEFRASSMKLMKSYRWSSLRMSKNLPGRWRAYRGPTRRIQKVERTGLKIT